MPKMLNFSKEDIDTMVNAYSNGSSLRSIGEMFDCSFITVRSYLKYRGVDIRKSGIPTRYKFINKKYSCDENFFEDINTPNKAYWLGFLYADGCMIDRRGKFNASGNGRRNECGLHITLKYSDKYILDRFLIDINSNHEIKYKLQKLGEREYPASVLNITSNKLFDDLEKHGCIKNKSLILKPPCLDNNLVSHFIRGYFDGDGCVEFYPDSKICNYSILGTYEMMKYIQNNSSISKRITIMKCKNIFRLMMGGFNNVTTFHNYIYRDANVYLKRKYDKSCEMIEYFNGIKRGYKKVICDNIVYKSIKDCAKAYNISKTSMYNWLNGKKEMPAKFKELDLSLLKDDSNG